MGERSWGSTGPVQVCGPGTEKDEETEAVAQAARSHGEGDRFTRKLAAPANAADHRCESGDGTAAPLARGMSAAAANEDEAAAQLARGSGAGEIVVRQLLASTPSTDAEHGAARVGGDAVGCAAGVAKRWLAPQEAPLLASYTHPTLPTNTEA